MKKGFKKGRKGRERMGEGNEERERDGKEGLKEGE